MEEQLGEKDNKQLLRRQRIYRYMSREAAKNSIYLKHAKEKTQESNSRLGRKRVELGNGEVTSVGKFSSKVYPVQNNKKKKTKRKSMLPVILFVLIFLIIIIVKISVSL